MASFKLLVIRVLAFSIIKGTCSRCPQRRDRAFFCPGMLLSQSSSPTPRKTVMPMINLRQEREIASMVTMQAPQVTACVCWQTLNMQISILSNYTKASCRKQSPWGKEEESFLMIYFFLRSCSACRALFWKQFMAINIPPSRIFNLSQFMHFWFSKGVSIGAPSAQTLVTSVLVNTCSQSVLYFLKIVVSWLAQSLNRSSPWLKVAINRSTRDWLIAWVGSREQAARRSKYPSSILFSERMRLLTCLITACETGKKSRMCLVAMQLMELARTKASRMNSHLQQLSQFMSLILTDSPPLPVSALWKRSQVSMEKTSSSSASMVFNFSRSTMVSMSREQQSRILSQQWLGTKVKKVKEWVSWSKRKRKYRLRANARTRVSRKKSHIEESVRQVSRECCYYEVRSQSARKNSLRCFIQGKLLNSSRQKVSFTMVLLLLLRASSQLTILPVRQYIFCRN